VLELCRADATTAALIFDYASHPTVLGPDNLAWSADWPGATRRALSALLGSRGGTGRPVAAFLQGAAGDASSRFVRRGRDYAEVRALGGFLAASIAHTLTALPAAPETGPVRLSRAQLRLPYRAVPSVEDSLALCHEAEGEWRRQLSRHCEDHPDVRIARTRFEGAEMLAGMAAVHEAPTGFADVPISVVSLGGIAWLHTPFELFASVGLRIRQASPFRHTRIIGYTDGYLGYLPDADGHRAGIYESYVTLFGPDAADVLVEQCLDLLRAHHGAPVSGVSGGRE
jgi:hypothetical protein